MWRLSRHFVKSRPQWTQARAFTQSGRASGISNRFQFGGNSKRSVGYSNSLQPRGRGTYIGSPSNTIKFNGQRRVRWYSVDSASILQRMNEIPLVHPLLLDRAEGMRAELAGIEGDDQYDTDKQIRAAYLAAVLEHYVAYHQEIDALLGLREMILDCGDDQELLQDATLEADEAISKLTRTVKKLQSRLLPPSPHDDKPAIIEIRPGVGGSEASLFAEDLMQMYINYVNFRGWKYEIDLQNFANSGSFNEGILSINFPGAFSQLRHESGVHRVQRVPATETKGRTHTLTAAVVVLPKMSSGKESSLREDERAFAPGEVRIDTMRAGGKGGQHVNTTDSAVRLVHIPTGITVMQQDERSQPKNKAKAFSILRARIAAQEEEKHLIEQRKMRTDHVTTTDRSDKIRTYNYQQNRVTDHRCQYLMHDLAGCMAGPKLQDIIDKMDEYELEARLAKLAV